MRKDMAKVIVERPRVGGNSARKGRRVSDELLPKQEGIKRPYGYETKDLNENLAPLRRFLLKQAGRLWNDVYSEISENISPSNIVQQHILQHVKDYVLTNVHKGEDDKFYEIKSWRGERLIEESYALLYVHPDTGILTKNPGTPRSNMKNIPGTWAYRREQERLNEVKTHLKCADGTELRRIDGIWYKFTLNVVPPVDEKHVPDENGNLILVRTPRYATDAFDGCRRTSGQTYRDKKIQLNSKDLKFYNLTNEIK